MVMEMDGPIGNVYGPRLVRYPCVPLDHGIDRSGADSVMLARAAERNPSVFLPAGPRCNVTEIVPKLLCLSEYTKNPWGNTKFLLNQFKPSPPPISRMPKHIKKEYQELVNKAKSAVELAEKQNIDVSPARCAEVMREVEAKIRERQADAEDQDVFEERREKEEKGEVVDEEVAVEGKAEVDGFEVGVGQAESGDGVEQAESEEAMLNTGKTA
jgi:tRNA-dihydrouridine synthase 2